MLKSINIPKSIETSLGNIDTRGLPLANTISNTLSGPLNSIKNIAENAEYYGGVDLSSLNKIIDKNNDKINKTVGKIQVYSDAVNLITGGFGTKIPDFNDLLDAADLLESDSGNRNVHLDNIKSIVNVINGDMTALLDFDKPGIEVVPTVPIEIPVFGVPPLPPLPTIEEAKKDFATFKDNVNIDLKTVDFSNLDEALGCSKEKMQTFKEVINPTEGSSRTLNNIRNRVEKATNDLDVGSAIMQNAFPQLKDVINPFKTTVDTAIGEYTAQLKGVSTNVVSNLNNVVGNINTRITGVANNATNIANNVVGNLDNVVGNLNNTANNLNANIVGRVENQLQYFTSVLENESGVSMQPLNIFFKNYIDRKNPLPGKINKVQNDINGYREILTDKISTGNSKLQGNIDKYTALGNSKIQGTIDKFQNTVDTYSSLSNYSALTGGNSDVLSSSSSYSEIVSSNNINISTETDCLDKQVAASKSTKEKNNPYERLLPKTPIASINPSVDSTPSKETSSLKDSLKLTIGSLPIVQDTLKMIDYNLENNIISKSLMMTSDISDEMTKLVVNTVQAATGTQLDPSIVANIKILADKNINKINTRVNENFSILRKVEKQKSILKSLII